MIVKIIIAKQGYCNGHMDYLPELKLGLFDLTNWVKRVGIEVVTVTIIVVEHIIKVKIQ